MGEKGEMQFEDWGSDIQWALAPIARAAANRAVDSILAEIL